MRCEPVINVTPRRESRPPLWSAAAAALQAGQLTAPSASRVIRSPEIYEMDPEAMRCEPCVVTWNEQADGAVCWVCGRPGEQGTTFDTPTVPYFAPTAQVSYPLDGIELLDMAQRWSC